MKGTIFSTLRSPSTVWQNKGFFVFSSRRQQFHSSPISAFQQTSIRFEKLTKSSSLDDSPSSSTELRSRFLRAPFQRVGGKGNALFPWRSSDQLLQRLVPGSEEFEQKGYLLGGNVFSSNPMFDAYATAYFFLRVPLYKMLYFSHWQADMAENMSWAFSQGVAGILSNVYKVPIEGIATTEGLDFKTNDTDETFADNPLDSDLLSNMVEGKLQSLFESAYNSGKDQFQIRLECRPSGTAHMVNLFVFPFLSRELLEIQPELRDRYQKMLQLMVIAPREALPMYHHFVQDFEARGYTDNTVIAQVLVPCDEIFWVKDLASGEIVQGQQDESNPRRVLHLVRMEMVVKTEPAEGLFLNFKHSQGSWQITDIDDLLGGNLII